ncbi:hypothetical protein D3C85_1349590 [compost metagenome]
MFTFSSTLPFKQASFSFSLDAYDKNKAQIPALACIGLNCIEVVCLVGWLYSGSAKPKAPTAPALAAKLTKRCVGISPKTILPFKSFPAKSSLLALFTKITSAVTPSAGVETQLIGIMLRLVLNDCKNELSPTMLIFASTGSQASRFMGLFSMR